MARDRSRCPGAGLYGIQKQTRTCSLHECYGRPFCLFGALVGSLIYKIITSVHSDDDYCKKEVQIMCLKPV